MATTRAYRSKIGRLPYAIRNELCERIRDGATGVEMISWINRHPAYKAVRKATGYGEINAANISDWRDSGYSDWLRDQDKTDHLRTLAEFADSIAAKTGGDPSAVGSRIVAGKLLDIIEGAAEADVGELVKHFAMLRAGETDARRTALAEEKNDLARQTLDLAREKFRRETCEMFLRWYNNKQALSIASGSGSNSDKIQALLNFMDKEQGQP